MADPTVSGLLGLFAFLAVLGVNALLLWRHGPRLASALDFAEARGEFIRPAPHGEPNVVRLRPVSRPCVAHPAAATPIRLAA